MTLREARDWYERFCISPASTIADAIAKAPAEFDFMFITIGVMSIAIIIVLGVW